MVNNTVETEIVTQGVPVLVAGVWTPLQSSHYAVDSAGRILYHGVRAVKATVQASISSVLASGNDSDVIFYFCKNGALLTDSAQRNTVKATATGNTALLWEENLVTGDYLEIFAANADGIINIVVQDAKMLLA